MPWKRGISRVDSCHEVMKGQVEALGVVRLSSQSKLTLKFSVIRCVNRLTLELIACRAIEIFPRGMINASADSYRIVIRYWKRYGQSMKEEGGIIMK